MSSALRFAVVPCAVLLTACRPEKGPTVPKGEPAWGDFAQLPEGEHVIAEPRAATAFLGHVVTPTASGWNIEPDLRVTCDPKPRAEPNGVHKRYAQTLDKVGGFDVGKAGWGRLYAEFERRARIVFDVTTDEILEIDPHGCGKPGEHVVVAVKVGRGSRSLETVSSDAAGADTPTWVRLSAGGKRYEGVEAEMDWQQPLAWSFTVAEITEGGLGLRARPSVTEVDDGSQYAIEIETRQQAWLLVVLTEADGRRSVLYPHPSWPHVVPAGERLALPVVAALRDPGVGTRDAVKVYALASEDIFLELRPPQGALSHDELEQYVQTLEQRLGRLAKEQWDAEEFSVRIDPAGGVKE